MRKRLIVVAALCAAALESLFDMSIGEFTLEVGAERRLQDAQWGGMAHDAQHSAFDWALIIVKHVGKLVSEVI